jgi:hypothetical protein
LLLTHEENNGFHLHTPDLALAGRAMTFGRSAGRVFVSPATVMEGWSQVERFT